MVHGCNGESRISHLAVPNAVSSPSQRGKGSDVHGRVALNERLCHLLPSIYLLERPRVIRSLLACMFPVVLLQLSHYLIEHLPASLYLATYTIGTGDESDHIPHVLYCHATGQISCPTEFDGVIHLRINAETSLTVAHRTYTRIVVYKAERHRHPRNRVGHVPSHPIPRNAA